MIVAFVDESGNNSESRIFVMATILMSHSSAYYFANDWKRVLGEFGIAEYHATEHHGSRYASLSDAIVGLLLKWTVKHSAEAIVSRDYQESFVNTGFHMINKPAITKWKKPYLKAFMDTVQNLREYADHQPRGVYITPVFDNCQEFMGTAQNDYRGWNKDGKLGGMEVSNTKRHTQLQASDFLAREYRLHAEQYISTGNPLPSQVLINVAKNQFGAKLWNLEMLELLRKRVVATDLGLDPETVIE